MSHASARNTQTLLTAGGRSLTAEAERSALAAASASVASLLALDGLTSVRVCRAGRGYLLVAGFVSSAFCAGCRQLVAGRRLQLLACLRSCVATDARTDALIFVVVACVVTASAQVTHRRLGTRRLALATHGLLRR